jgi:hypothetical protein
MAKVADEEGKKALAENERLRQDPSAEVPASLYQKGLRIVRRAVAAAHYRAVRKTAVRFVSKVAIVVLVAVLSLGTAFALSPELQSKVAQWAIEHYADHTEFTIPNSNASDPTERGIIDDNGFWVGSLLDLVVDSIPDGMQLVDSGKDELGIWEIYSDSTRRILITASYLGGSTFAVDTENASMSLVMINGRLALFSSSDIHCSAFIPMSELEGYLFIDFEGFSDDEALSISENIFLK